MYFCENFNGSYEGEEINGKNLCLYSDTGDFDDIKIVFCDNI